MNRLHSTYVNALKDHCCNLGLPQPSKLSRIINQVNILMINSQIIFLLVQISRFVLFRQLGANCLQRMLSACGASAITTVPRTVIELTNQAFVSRKLSSSSSSSSSTRPIIDAMSGRFEGGVDQPLAVLSSTSRVGGGGGNDGNPSSGSSGIPSASTSSSGSGLGGLHSSHQQQQHQGGHRRVENTSSFSHPTSPTDDYHQNF